MPETFTFMHLEDAFIQSDLQVFRLYIFCQHVCFLGIEPTTFALLTQCSTTEPQEHTLGITSISSVCLPLQDESLCIPQL